MKKILSLLGIVILVSIVIVGCSSCDTFRGDERNPLINTDDFQDYEPWWIASNNVYHIEDLMDTMIEDEINKTGEK